MTCRVLSVEYSCIHILVYLKYITNFPIRQVQYHIALTRLGDQLPHLSSAPHFFFFFFFLSLSLSSSPYPTCSSSCLLYIPHTPSLDPHTSLPRCNDQENCYWSPRLQHGLPLIRLRSPSFNYYRLGQAGGLLAAVLRFHGC